MSYDISVMVISNGLVRVVISVKNDESAFDMTPVEARRFALGVIDTANDADNYVAAEGAGKEIA